ncbi:MAG TPA: DM13 domain-containing protein [Acidimicrobiia bacterium]
MSRLNKRNMTVGAVVIGVPALLVAWWLLSPLYLDTEVDEEFPMSASAQVPDEMTPEEVEAAMKDAAEAPDSETEEPMPAEGPVLVTLATGEFQDADEFHQGSGTATIYQLEDGSLVLRLENFEVTNGPDLRVLLASGSSPSAGDELGDYIELAGLKGNIGDQNYEIPDDVDLSLYSSVVIYCKPFHVVFSAASLN